MKRRIGDRLVSEYTFRKLDSTSSFLKLNYLKYPSYTFIRAIEQTSGHGRMNRTWISNKESLTFSLLIKDKEVIERYSSLSLLSAYSVFNVIKKYDVSNLSIKWPNDVYIGDKKVSGILLESISSSDILALIIGIGVNVNNSKIENENAVSIREVLKNKINIKDFKDELYLELIRNINSLMNGDNTYLDVIRNNNYLLNKEVYGTIDNEKRIVKVLGINDDNSLRVLLDNKEVNLFTDEITFHNY